MSVMRNVRSLLFETLSDQMCKMIGSILVGVAVVAVAQNSGTGVGVRPSGPAPRWEKGVVNGGTYKNGSIGLELTPPAGLEFGTPELKGDSGTVSLLVTITAVGKEMVSGGREVMAYYSDALAYYPSTRRSTEAYLLRVVDANQKDGFDPVGDRSETELGGVTFARQDFKKGNAYEGVLVKACQAQALVFIFGGADREAVNRLIAGTEVKLDSATSGCRPNAQQR